ncbi:hypothetical protein [Qipengyuania sp. ASV99]|uniref:hypothetical protein n=1 Tax=Qipengyuania sp. ASV99 TaxID=3399681 RepID=UPI003A4C608B
MADENPNLTQRISAQLDTPVDSAVREFAQELAEQAEASAVLFYGSNLRTGSLDGVLDFYVLLPDAEREGLLPNIWPKVSYHEREFAGTTLRAKAATMALSTFAKAAAGDLIDTTIWARFVQPSALVWQCDEAVREQVVDAVRSAAIVSARLAAVLGPASGAAEDFWRALFQATYKAEFRVEKAGRENDILNVNAAHFAGLLPLALDAGGVAYTQRADRITPSLPATERTRVKSWWSRRQKLGKPLNLVRLVKASTTFDGAARYAAWKIERHTGMAVSVTPFRERHPLLSAPGVLWALRKHRKRAGNSAS